MATLPASTVSPTVAAIWQHWERQNEPPRAHLGASVIGRPCVRQLWYSFRWAYVERLDGRMLRLFDRGKREEAVLSSDLRAIGVTLHTVDPRTGQQFQFSAVGGHVGGSMDGAGIGFPEAPKAWHVVEFKTHSTKSFQGLQAGVEKAKPEHWAQMQLYMHWSGMERAMYLAVCKDTDEIIAERVHYNAEAAQRLEERAERIVTAATPPAGISEDPTWWECKFCPAARVCHKGEGMAVNCRTCVHSTPEMEGAGRWSCALHKRDISTDEQRNGCAEHRLIPELIPWAKAVDGDAEANWIEYEAPAGRFRNGGDGGLTSAEIAIGRAVVVAANDPAVSALREEMGAEIKGASWMQPAVWRVA